MYVDQIPGSRASDGDSCASDSLTPQSRESEKENGRRIKINQLETSCGLILWEALQQESYLELVPFGGTELVVIPQVKSCSSPKSKDKSPRAAKIYSS
jgi:hypothetical protein